MATDDTPTLAAPDHYIVRIYRRAPPPGGRIAGTVEVIGSGTHPGAERSFATLRELEQILCAPPARPPP
jgi:hypothetical protein